MPTSPRWLTFFNIAAPERGGGGGVLLKSFTFVSGFTEEIPPSALTGSHLPFQGRLLQKKHFCATSSAVMSKPSGGIRSLHSLSAWGLPTPVVAFSCIGNVDIQVFSGADSQLYFVRRLQVCISRLPFRAPEGRALC